MREKKIPNEKELPESTKRLYFLKVKGRKSRRFLIHEVTGVSVTNNKHPLTLLVKKVLKEEKEGGKEEG